MSIVTNPTTTSNVTQGSTNKPAGTATTTTGVQATGANGEANETAKSSASLGKTFDDFLTLLTVQLKNQDPLSPMDSAQFTSQLVGFAGVEQQIAQNDKLAKMLEFNKSQELLNASGYIGKTIEAETDKIVLKDDEAAKFSVTVDGKSQQTIIAIRNSTGQTVRTLNLTLDAGNHQMQWDGKTNEGQDAPSGIYTLAVTATDERGDPITSKTFGISKVTDVKQDDTDGTLLSMSGATVTLGKVVRIVQGTVTTTAAPPPSGGGGNT
jgi:flagellar basal-body rod modification protein FlgD